MNDYCNALIREQINRGLYLKKLIPHPFRYPELESLAERCGRILDSNIERLTILLEELTGRDEGNNRDILRGIRRGAREIELVEYFGISALFCETDEIGYLNKLVYKLHREINLPLTPPCVACISTKYYYFHPFTNVIFVPVGESAFLLHLPDMIHEIGHAVISNRGIELRLAKINECYSEAIKKITEYYRELYTRKSRETGPPRISLAIEISHSQWKNYWISEFFCDLFAAYTIGPAYAWSHLHLVTKKSKDVYEYSPILPQSHPSDDSRMRMLLMALRKIGFEDESLAIEARWKEIPLVANAHPVVEYQYAYPDDLLKEVTDIILMGLRESNFTRASKVMLERGDPTSIVSLLNQAWERFWDNAESFRSWEEDAVQTLKSTVFAGQPNLKSVGRIPVGADST